jgi:hypothetical protein
MFLLLLHCWRWNLKSVCLFPAAGVSFYLKNLSHPNLHFYKPAVIKTVQRFVEECKRLTGQPGLPVALKTKFHQFNTLSYSENPMSFSFLQPKAEVTINFHDINFLQKPTNLVV